MSRHHLSRDVVRLRALAAAILLGVVAAPVRAETGSANASDVSIHINVLGLADLDVTPQAPAGFSGVTTSTDVQASVPSIDVGNVAANVSTGLVMSDAEYVPGAGLSFAAAENNIANLNISAVGLLSQSLLSITANVVDVQSEVLGYCLPAGRAPARDLTDDITFFNGFEPGNLMPGGIDPSRDPGVTFDGLGMQVLGTPVPDLPTNPPPNTGIDLAPLGIVGATLVLNEQAISGDLVNTATLSSNAIHLTLGVAGLITADVMVGHADSTLDCTQ